MIIDRDNLVHLLPHTNRVGYVGWLGHANLGDEALYVAIQKLFNRLVLVPYKCTPKTRVLERVWRGRGLYKTVMLGGGTLVGASGVYNVMREGFERYGDAMMYGTGVVDPEFAQRFPGHQDTLSYWAELLSHFNVRTVRGPRSRQILQEHGLTDVTIIGDPALALADQGFVRKKGTKKIAVNFGISGGRIWGSEEDVSRWGILLIRTLLERGWSVTLFPVWTKDLEYLQHLRKETNNKVHIFADFLHVQRSLDFLRSCDVLVGEKLHSVVLAHCVGTPALMLEYQPKCRDYMEVVGHARFVMRTDELSIDRAMEQVDMLANAGDQIQSELHERIRYLVRLQKEVANRAASRIIERSFPQVA